MKKLKTIIGSMASKSAALALALVCAGSAWGAYTPTYMGGEGTENNPYTIGSAEALAEMAAYFADPGKTTTYIKITQSFSCSNVDYEPPSIGSQGSGTRLAGHKVYIYADEPVVISGLTVSKTGNVGLIGEVAESTVLLSMKNITLSGVTIDGNNTSANGAGAFVGWFPGNALVLDNCHVVNSTVGNSKQTGGLVGYLMGNGDDPYATFTDCSIENSTINAGASAVGGFVGYCCVPTAKITGGVSSGNTFNSTLQDLVGSFVGRFNSSTTVGTLSDITASGNKAVLSSSEITDIPNVGAVLNGATYTVVESATYVAQIGTTKYATFADAIAAAGENDEIIVLDDTATVPAGWKIADGKLVEIVYVAAAYDSNNELLGRYEDVQSAVNAAGAVKVVMLADYVGAAISNPSEHTATVTISSGKSITLDLAGFSLGASIYADNDNRNYPHVIWVNGGSLTVIDSSEGNTGSIVNTCTTYTWSATYTTIRVDNGTFNMQGGTITATTGRAFTAVGTSASPSTVTFASGTTLNAQYLQPEGGYSASTAGIYLGGYVNLTVNGAVVTSVGRAALFVDGSDNVVSIIDGVFTGASAYGAIRFDVASQNTISITGGYYSSDPVDLLANGYGRELVSDGALDGYYHVRAVTVTNVTVTTLEELKAALASATELDLVNAVVSGNIAIDETVAVPTGCAITISDGYTLSVADNGLLLNDGTISNNGTLSVTGTGFLSNPTAIENNGAVSGYPEVVDGVYTITKPMDFQWLSFLNSSSGTAVDNVVLANDIAIPNGVTFDTVPEFSGTFDGNGHRVTGIVINSTANYKSIFGRVEGAEIKNATFTVNSTVGGSASGGLVGRSYGHVHIVGVTMNGTINNNSSASWATGPFVGYVCNNGSHLYIADCTNNTAITCSGQNAGLVVGTCGGLGSGKLGVYNYVNTGSLSAPNSNGTTGCVTGWGEGTIEVIDYANNGGTMSNTYGSFACDAAHIVGQGSYTKITTYFSTDYTAYYHEDEDIYNTEPPPVAKIISSDGATTNNYADVATAISEITSGCTLKLMANASISSATAVANNLTVDLNGHTLTSSGAAFNVTAGSLTLTGNGSVTSTGSALTISGTGTTFVMAGVAISGTSDAIVWTALGGTITLADGTTNSINAPNSGCDGIYANPGSASTMTINGNGTLTTYGAYCGLHSTKANPYISAPNFKASGGNNGLQVDNNGSDGDKKGVSAGLYSNDVSEYCNDGLLAFLTSDATYHYMVAEALVSLDTDMIGFLTSGGDSEATLTATCSGSVVWSSSDETVATVDQTGKVTKVGAGTAVIKATAENGSYASCSVTVGDPVARNESTSAEYVSLLLAVKAASSGDTISLVANESLVSALVVPSGTTLTIDLNGYVLNCTNSDNSNSLIQNAGTLTIAGTTSGSAVVISGGKGLLHNTGTATLNGGSYTYTSGNYIVRNDGGTMTVNGGVYRGSGISGAFNCWNASTLVVNDADVDLTCNYYIFCSQEGSSVTVNSGSYRKVATQANEWERMMCIYSPDPTSGLASSIKIKGGTFTYVNEFHPTNHDLAMIVYQTNPSSYTGPVDLEISGGTFNGASTGIRISHSHYCQGTITAVVSGGTFTSRPPVSGDPIVLAEGATVVDNGNNTWTVVPPAVAQIGDDKYTTFADAIAAAEEYFTTNGSYPPIAVLNGATEQDNPDWKIANGQLVKKVYVAQIGTTKYETLAEALSNAQDLDMVVLIADAVLPSQFTFDADKAITLDLAGHAITSTADDLLRVESGALTVNDSVGGGSVFTDNWTVFCVAGGEVVVNGGRFSATQHNTVYVSGGWITFNGGMVDMGVDSVGEYSGEDVQAYEGLGENAGYTIFAEPLVSDIDPLSPSRALPERPRYTPLRRTVRMRRRWLLLGRRQSKT